MKKINQRQAHQKRSNISTPNVLLAINFLTAFLLFFFNCFCWEGLASLVHFWMDVKQSWDEMMIGQCFSTIFPEGKLENFWWHIEEAGKNIKQHKPLNKTPLTNFECFTILSIVRKWNTASGLRFGVSQWLDLGINWIWSFSTFFKPLRCSDRYLQFFEARRLWSTTLLVFCLWYFRKHQDWLHYKHNFHVTSLQVVLFYNCDNKTRYRWLLIVKKSQLSVIPSLYLFRSTDDSDSSI